MSAIGIQMRAPSAEALDAALAEARAADVTYDHIGSTLHTARWPDRVPYETTIRLGDAPGAFTAGADGLRAWACHRGIRALVHPAITPLELGESLLVILPVGPVRVIVPNRIIEVLDEPARFGFAYGSLPGHQERGEEAFIVERHADGAVSATVRVDAVPATRATRLAAPAIGPIQRFAVQRYLAALAAYVTNQLD